SWVICLAEGKGQALLSEKVGPINNSGYFVSTDVAGNRDFPLWITMRSYLVSAAWAARPPATSRHGGSACWAWNNSPPRTIAVPATGTPGSFGNHILKARPMCLCWCELTN